MPSFLAITYAFFLAYMPYHTLPAKNDVCAQYYNATHVGYELGVDLFDCVHLYTGEETKQYPINVTSWCPYTQGYYLGAEYHKVFNEQLVLSAGVKHYCEHPIASWDYDTNDYNSAVTSVYVRVEGRITVFRR